MRAIQLVPLALVTLLAGCFGGDIGKVKDSRMKGWPEFTVGQLLNKREACSKTEWESFKDTRDRKIVQYTCENQRIKDSLKRVTGEDISKREMYKGLVVESAQKELELAESYVASVAERLQEDRVAVAKLESGQGADLPSYESNLRMRRQYLAQTEGDVDAAAEKLALARTNIENAPSDPKMAKYDADIEEYKRKFDSLKAVREISQWAIQDGEPVYLGSKIEIVFPDQTKEEMIKAEYVFDQAAKDGSAEASLHGFYSMQYTALWHSYQLPSKK